MCENNEKKLKEVDGQKHPVDQKYMQQVNLTAVLLRSRLIS